MARLSSFRGALGAALVLVAPAALGQGVTVGRLTSNLSGFLPVGGVTFVDLANPAMVAGNVTTATVRWINGNSSPCTAAFKVKIFRPPTPNQPGFPTLTLVAERGPFDQQGGYVTVPLAPPIAVQKGDVIGVAQLKPGCGGVLNSVATAGSIIMVNADFAGGSLTGTFSQGVQLLARAAGAAEVLDGVIAAGGAVTGSNGSFFRTSAQLTNLDLQASIAGKLVFHAAGRSALPNDPFVTYSLAPGATVSFPDVVASMGQSGLGSLDLITNGSAPPQAVVRVFDDQGTAGTKGFIEDVIHPAYALRTSERLAITIPDDLTNYRVNVGVRTLDAGAQLNVALLPEGGGATINTTTKTYSANFFEQVPLATFVGAAPRPNGSASIFVTSGSAIIYWSTTDNRTNDSATKFLTRP